MANSVDPDQTARLRAICSGSALFAKTCLSENLGPLQYTFEPQHNKTNKMIVRPATQISLGIRRVFPVRLMGS